MKIMTERAAQGYHFWEDRGGRALADLIDTFLLFQNQFVIILVTEVEQKVMTSVIWGFAWFQIEVELCLSA